MQRNKNIKAAKNKKTKKELITLKTSSLENMLMTRKTSENRSL